MRLRQLKIRGLGDLPVTGWLSLSTTITLLRFPDREVGRQALEAVQSLNPPFDCRLEQPFRNLPLETISANGYRRTISPEKRTIVFGIFDTPAVLVRELGAITPPLYETDRVEVGRRLDYSRWINFVELASSTRWSEVSEGVKMLLQRISPSGTDAPAIHHLVSTTSPTDRVKGGLAETLAGWLAGLHPHEVESDDLDQLLEKVLRAKKFTQARETIAKRLPLFLRYEAGQPLNDADREMPNHSVQPVLLIDCFGSAEPDTTADSIPESIGLQLQHYQCLCFSDLSHPGWNLPPEQIIDA